MLQHKRKFTEELTDDDSTYYDDRQKEIKKVAKVLTEAIEVCKLTTINPSPDEILINFHKIQEAHVYYDGIPLMHQPSSPH